MKYSQIQQVFCAVFVLMLAQQVVAKPVQRYLPLPFSTESGQLRTSVCAQVTEQEHVEPMWWKADGKNLDASQRALKSVIDAILRKDKRKLESLSSDAGNVGDNYQKQIEAMLHFGDYLQSMDSVHLYEVAPLLVALGRLQVNGKPTIATFVFLKQRDTYSLLPVRPQVSAYDLIRDWANSPWGMLSATGPGYCSNEEIARTDHRFTLASRPDAAFRTSMPVEIRLTPTAGKPATGGSSSRVLDTYARMKEAARKNAFSQLIGFIRPDDAKLLGNFASDQQFAGQRESLKQTLLGEEPIAIVDAGPLQVLYTRASSGGEATVWYFLATGKGAPQWANVSRVARLDSVFKDGPLFATAGTDPTFEKLRKRQ